MRIKVENSGNRSPRRIKLPHKVIVRAPGLLPMLYKVRELAEELSVPDRTLRDWLVSGAPHQRDKRGHIWINGRAFARWVYSHRKRKSPPKLGKNEAYCIHCNSVTQMNDPQILHVQGKLHLLKSTCTHCNGTVTRGIKHDQQKELPVSERTYQIS